MPDLISHKFTTATAAREFILSGAAVFTIVSKKTNARYTFKVQDGDNIHFVKLAVGGNRTFTYLGVIRHMTFTVTRKSTMMDTSTPVAAFRYMLEWLEQDTIAPHLEIWHEGRCGRCGHRLTDPTSIERGFGPECIEVINSQRNLHGDH